VFFTERSGARLRVPRFLKGGGAILSHSVRHRTHSTLHSSGDTEHSNFAQPESDSVRFINTNNYHHDVRLRLLPYAACSPVPSSRGYVPRLRITALGTHPFATTLHAPPSLTRIVVWVKRGICSADSLINIALCCLGVLPGLLHAWYIILQYPDTTYQQVPDHERGGDNAGTTYYVITHEQPGRREGYGTLGSAPSGGQFPGQQGGGVGTFGGQQQKNVKAAKGASAKGAAASSAPQSGAGGEGSSNQPEAPPPTYADVIKGDNKVQKP
jgi:uncharacterized membrane protein YqaE (UPF0057 family)